MRPPMSRTAYDLLREQADRAPGRPVVITVAETVTYAALAGRAGAVAAALRAEGIGRGNRIGLLVDNRVAWLEIFFAASALGAVVVPFSTWSTAAELAFLIADAKLDLLFTLGHFGDRDFAGDIAALQRQGFDGVPRHLVLVEGEPREGFEPYERFRHGLELGNLPPGLGASAADPLVILYTSGSSNRPKAVPLDHFALIENGFNIGERQGLQPGDRVLVAIPLFWSYGVANALPATLTHGATLVLQGRFEAGGALDLIECHQCTALYTLPAMTSALLAHPAFKPERTRSLRTGVTIGSAQDVIRTAEALGAAGICNIYGSTETYGNCCVTPHDWPLVQRASCQGPPLPGVTLRIRNEASGELCAAGATGLVEVSGYLTRGYAGESAKHNAEVFTTDGFFRTGDLGLLSPDGVFTYAGRSSEMIKRSGINVSPAEVEEVLQQRPEVALAGVTGLPDPRRGEIIVAFVVPRPGALIDAGALLAHCREKLSRYKIPDRIEIAAALPLTVTGKLMRRDLKSLAAGLEPGP